MGAAALAMSLAIIACRRHQLRGSVAQAAEAQAPRMGFCWSFLLAAVWILAMMWSRTALQVHWLTDTIAGAFIGIAVAVLVDEFWTLTAQRTRSPRFALWLAG